MALYVNTNVSSLNANRQLANSTKSLDTSYQRLASGLRINSAKDDAAGLQISDRMTSQINGLNQGNRNAQDGISFAQTAEGAMDEMTTMYQRIRTLALQSANGTNNTDDRAALQQEVTQLCTEIDRIATQTTFGGQKILDGTVGTSGAVDFQVGADANQKIGVNLSTGQTGKLAWTVYGTGLAGGLDATDDLKNTATGDGNQTGFKSISATGNGTAVFCVETAEDAQKVLEHIDSFIGAVDSKRAELGAVQNRLESTIRNQSNVAQNLSDARSQIRDTDFATETANMTQTSIIQQASQSILSQANQRPQLALSLMG